MSYPLIPRSFRGGFPARISDGWFAQALQRAQQNRRLTVKELARIIGRTPKATEHLLAGNNEPQLDAVVRAAAALDEVWTAMRAECRRSASTDDAEAILSEVLIRLKEKRDA